ncbi:hypothetical protein Tco_1226440 [Tanacetum coccineum]
MLESCEFAKLAICLGRSGSGGGGKGLSMVELGLQGKSLGKWQEHFLRHCELHNGLNYTSDIVSYTMVSSYFPDIVGCAMVSLRSQTFSFHNALTVSPVVSTTFVEQFWMSAKSKIINNVRYITAKVAGKPVSISDASIRSDLLFYDANGIDSLPNQAIFDVIQLMGYEGDLTLKSVLVPLDHFPVNALTSKVFSFMVKKGKHLSGKATPLFSNMLVQPTEDEGEQSERPSEPHLTPSPSHPSEVQVEPQSDSSPRSSPTTHIPDSILEISGGNHGGQSSSDKSLSRNEGDMTLQSVYDLCISLCTQGTDQSKEIKHLKAHIKKLKKKAKPGRKPAKAEPSVHKDPLFDELADDTLDYIDTENAQDMGRSRFVVHEEKEREEKEVSIDDALGTDKKKVSTDKEKVSTDKEKDSTDKEKDSTDRLDEGTEGRSATPITPTPTPTTFGDDETIAQVLLNMSQAKAVSREKEKGVELKDKCKKKIEEDESDTESEDIKETEKKFKMLAHDEEIARKMQEDCETEEERKRLAEEEATNVALIQDFDDIKARMEVDRLLALRLQEGEREQFIVEEREKFLHDTITAQRRFDESFIAVGSTEDERKIKEMNEGAKDLEHKRLKKKVAKETPKKEDTSKVPAKVDVTEQGTKKRKGGHIKMLARKRKRPQSDVDSDDEHRKCLKIVTFEGVGKYKSKGQSSATKKSKYC